MAAISTASDLDALLHIRPTGDGDWVMEPAPANRNPGGFTHGGALAVLAEAAAQAAGARALGRSAEGLAGTFGLDINLNYLRPSFDVPVTARPCLLDSGALGAAVMVTVYAPDGATLVDGIVRVGPRPEGAAESDGRPSGLPPDWVRDYLPEGKALPVPPYDALHSRSFRELLGLHTHDHGEGWAVGRLPVSRSLRRGDGPVSLGLLVALIDCYAGQTYVVRYRPGLVYSINLQCQLYRPVAEGELRIYGRLVRAGRQIGVTSGAITDGNGRLVALGMGSFIVSRAG